MGAIPISMSSLGPVDHGKSTLFGYLVLNSKKDERYWKEVETWEKNKPNWYRQDRVYTYIFDRLKDERQGHLYADGRSRFEGASIVPTHIECEIAGKSFLLIDVPGHEKFISNTTIGVFQAQSGVLVLAANDLEAIIQVFQEIKSNLGRNITHRKIEKAKFWNILLYPVLIRTYGFRHLIVVISKMDLVDFEKICFELALDHILPPLAEYSGLGKETIRFIPTSIDVNARSDLNVINSIPPKHKMSWYKGPTLHNALSEIKPLKPAKGRLLIPVEKVYWKRLPEAPLIFTGCILRGKITQRQKVQIAPLCDPLCNFNNPDKLRGRVKNIRQRDQSARLPWIGKLSLEPTDPDSTFEAGHVVGISLHPYGKYNWDRFTHYFRKGCIITGDGDEIVLGNILKAEVFVPSYNRQIIRGDTWLLYIYGQRKGNALVLSVSVRDPLMNERGEQLIGHFVDVELLLDFPTAYPALNEDIDVDHRDVVLRHNRSFCGGRTIGLYFAECMKATIQYDQDSYPERNNLIRPFERFHSLKRLRCQWEVKAAEKCQWEVVALNPTSSEIRLICQILRKMIPKPLFIEIKLAPSVS